MSGRAPISVGIQPQIALYSVVLGAACAMAAYTEKYRRNQDNIDDQIKERYYASMRDQQAKIPQMTQAIRGQDFGRVDSTMNKLVWGGYASMPPAGGGGDSSGSALVADDNDDKSSNQSQNSSTRGNSLVVLDVDGDSTVEDSSKWSKKERKRRRKLKKQQEKQKQIEMKLQEERQKLVVQSVTAGAAVGAAAVAASFLLSSRK